MIKLPRKASELILLALDDLKRVERSKKYVVDMGTFHSPDTDYNGDVIKGAPCMVCFAGGVIAGTLGAKPTEEKFPEDFGAYNAKRLEALDNFRAGRIEDGLRHLGVSEEKIEKANIALGVIEGPFGRNAVVTSYATDNVAFRLRLTAIAGSLAALGL